MKRTSRLLTAVLLAVALAGCGQHQTPQPDPAIAAALEAVKSPVESFLGAQTLSYEYTVTVTSPDGAVSGLGTCLFEQKGPAWYERQSLFGEGALSTGVSYETLYVEDTRWVRQQKLISSSMAAWTQEQGTALPSGMEGLAALLAKPAHFSAVRQEGDTYIFTLSDAYFQTVPNELIAGTLTLTVQNGALMGLRQESTEKLDEGDVTTMLTITELRMEDPNVPAQIEGEQSALS